MKIITSSNGRKTIRMSREEWTNIGEKSGWWENDTNWFGNANKEKKEKPKTVIRQKVEKFLSLPDSNKAKQIFNKYLDYYLAEHDGEKPSDTYMYEIIMLARRKARQEDSLSRDEIYDESPGPVPMELSTPGPKGKRINLEDYDAPDTKDEIDELLNQRKWEKIFRREKNK